MSFKTNLTLFSLSLLLSSCAYLRNPAEVMVTIDSEPIGAKIYIDDKYYGDTVRQIYLVPNKDYNLKLVKDGYQTVNDVMRTERSFRRKRSIDKRRCKSDMIFSPLVLPFFSLMSDKCRDFEKKVYFLEMPKAGMPFMDVGYQNVPPQYVPPQSQGNVENHYGATTTYYTVTPQPTQPMSASYNDPYQNYHNPSANSQQEAGQVATQRQAPNDFDSSYSAPIYYDQNYQPVATQQQAKPPHVY